MVTHRFHTDRRGDSVTVLVYDGAATSAVELLVNGKAVALGKVSSSEVCELDAPLPTSPPTPVHVTLRQPGRGADPDCVLLIGGVELPWDEISTGG